MNTIPKNLPPLTSDITIEARPLRTAYPCFPIPPMIPCRSRVIPTENSDGKGPTVEVEVPKLLHPTLEDVYSCLRFFANHLLQQKILLETPVLTSENCNLIFHKVRALYTKNFKTITKVVLAANELKVIPFFNLPFLEKLCCKCTKSSEIDFSLNIFYHLSRLSLQNCLPKIGLSKQIFYMTSLKHLQLDSCKIKNLFLSYLPNLEYLIMRNCLKDVSELSLHNMRSLCFVSIQEEGPLATLTKISLLNLRKLLEFPQSLFNATNLTEIEIKGVGLQEIRIGNINALSSFTLIETPNLRRLILGSDKKGPSKLKKMVLPQIHQLVLLQASRCAYLPPAYRIHATDATYLHYYYPLILEFLTSKNSKQKELNPSKKQKIHRFHCTYPLTTQPLPPVYPKTQASPLSTIQSPDTSRVFFPLQLNNHTQPPVHFTPSDYEMIQNALQ